MRASSDIMAIGDALGGLLIGVVAFVLMIVMAIVSFFITVFVVDFGASLAGYPDNDFTVLSAALLTAAALLAGGLSPVTYLSQPVEPYGTRSSDVDGE